MPLRKPVKGRFPLTPSSSSNVWISVFVSLVLQASQLIKFKLLFALYLRLIFYSVCLPLIAFVILFGNLLERHMSRYRRRSTEAVNELAHESNATHRIKQDGNGNGSLVSLVVSAVSRQEVIHFLQDKLECRVRAAVCNGGDSLSSACNRSKEPIIFEEMIPKYLTSIASSSPNREADTNDLPAAEIDVIRITRHSPMHHVNSSYLVVIKSSDLMFLHQALRAFDPTLTIRHEDKESVLIEKSPEIYEHFDRLVDFADSCQTFIPFRKKLNEVIDFCDKEKATAAVLYWIKESLMHAESITITLKVLISQMMRRISCCSNYQFLLFKKLNKSEVDRDNLSLAYSDCLPSELLKRIQESSGLSPECIALSCISSALRSYAQEMTGGIPRDTSVFLQSSRELDGLDGSNIVLPVESAHDLTGTSAKVEHVMADSVKERESNRRNKQLMMRTLPSFMFDQIQSIASSNHEIVVKFCHVEGDEQSFIRSVHYWPTMSRETMLSMTVMQRKESLSIGISCKKDAIQSATLLAELITKSVTNLCIAFRVQWDRRSPPSTPSDISSQSGVTL